MSGTDDKKIRISMDGPYEVTGNIPLSQSFIECDDNGDAASWREGKAYTTPNGFYKLCRCGRSRDKPFCDGSHEDAGFNGREFADRAPYKQSAELQKGETLDLFDDESLCIGARFCDRGDTVWGLVGHSGDPQNQAMAIEEASNCPSGRLTVTTPDGADIEPEFSPEINVIEDTSLNCRGPLWVKGGIAIEGAKGERYEQRNRVTLCRCGQSKNQPYCDGSHYDCDYMQGVDE